MQSALYLRPGGAKLQLVDGNNLVFDAIQREATEGASGASIGAAEKVIRGIVWGAVERETAEANRENPDGAALRDALLQQIHSQGSPASERALAAAVEEWANRYRKRWPGIRMSPTDLAANWTRL